MKPTTPEPDVRPSQHPFYPSMTGEERLKALRSIRGMWKGKAQDIVKRIEEGREDRGLSTEEE